MNPFDSFKEHGFPADSSIGSADLLELHEAHPTRYPVLLESVDSEATNGRYDLLLALPGEQLIGEGGGELRYPDGSIGQGSFLDALDDWCARERSGHDPQQGEHLFTGGWFLYLGYELAGEIEPSVILPAPRHARAVAWRRRGVGVRDRFTGATGVCSEAAGETFTRQVIDDVKGLKVETGARPAVDTPCLDGQIQEQDAAIFLGGVEAILEAIGRGDVYQANLSRPWQARLADGVSVAELYRRLRRANPAPFAASAHLPGFSVLSSSPERLLRISDGVASTRPIAGTRPRGTDMLSDDALKRELKLNEKERAEHVMLVDLERNDLGRICRAGTVVVDEFMTIESYAHVHHIVSNVRGMLNPGVTAGQAIRAVFPGGTITGCPKVRCMQLLAEFEKEPRDAYTGSVGYLGRDGTLDLNILIRTLTVTGGRVEFRTGGGIVADSQPLAELAETRAKARGLLRALGSEA